MNRYKKIRLINLAAKEAYEEGSLNTDQYIKLINDLQNEIIVLDGLKIQEDFKELILQYSS